MSAEMLTGKQHKYTYKLPIDVSLVSGNWGYKNLYRLFQKTRSSMQGGSEKGEGEKARMHVLGGEHGLMSFVSLSTVCHMCANCRTVYTNSLWTHSQPLALDTPSSNACPSCPLGLRLYITASQLEETYGGLLIYSSSKKGAEESLHSWMPLFLCPKSHVHVSQEPATSLFTVCQLKSHKLISIASLYSDLSVWQSFKEGLCVGAHTFSVLGTKLRTLRRMLGKCFITKLHPSLSL